MRIYPAFVSQCYDRPSPFSFASTCTCSGVTLYYWESCDTEELIDFTDVACII